MAFLRANPPAFPPPLCALYPFVSFSYAKSVRIHASIFKILVPHKDLTGYELSSSMSCELSTPSLARSSRFSLPSFRPPHHRVFTPLSLPLFSYTYELPNFQALCFQILMTVGVGVYACLQKRRTGSPSSRFVPTRFPASPSAQRWHIRRAAWFRTAQGRR